jgi:hypothetical protein
MSHDMSKATKIDESHFNGIVNGANKAKTAELEAEY